MNLREIYGKRFTFQATSYEEYEKGVCTGRGSLNASIQSKIVIDQESYRQSGALTMEIFLTTVSSMAE